MSEHSIRPFFYILDTPYTLNTPYTLETPYTLKTPHTLNTPPPLRIPITSRPVHRSAIWRDLKPGTSKSVAQIAEPSISNSVNQLESPFSRQQLFRGGSTESALDGPPVTRTAAGQNMVSVFSKHPKFITTTLPTRKVTPAQIHPTARNHPNACSSIAISTDEDTKIICERLEKGRVFVVIRSGWRCCECDRYGINVRHRFPRPNPSTYPLGHGVEATANRGSYV